jgi:hypothetical protein
MTRGLKTVNAANDGGSSNDVPWASVFDSAANMRALSAIQADGFRAASELVDRFVRMASTGLGGVGRPAPPTPQPDQQPADLYGATGLEPLVASWWAMVDQFLRASAPRDGQQVQPGADLPASLDFAGTRATGRLYLEAVPAGTATAEVWLHNAGPVDMGKVRLRCGDLLAHDGSLVRAQMLRFEPDIVAMPGRSARGVTVELEVGDDVAPGNYRGMLLADGHPDLWLPVELAVKPLVP